jgi:biotin transporter BioY
MLTFALALIAAIAGYLIGYVFGAGAVVTGVKAEREKNADILAACVAQTESALNLLRQAQIVVVPPPSWTSETSGARRH